nr:hypothetical protein Ade03nite_50100 [Actinoplanes derwentensis]
MFGRVGDAGADGAGAEGEADAGWAAAGRPGGSALALQPAMISNDVTSVVYRKVRKDMAGRQLHRRRGLQEGNRPT